MRCPRRLVCAALLAGAGAAQGLAVEWPERLEQCQPALLRFSDVGGSAAAVEVGVRRGPRLDRAFILEQLPPSADAWNWTAVDAAAGSAVLLHVAALSGANLTLAATLAHYVVQLPPDGRNDTSCLHSARGSGGGGTRRRSTEVTLIGGILGGILALLLLLILGMCWRRRREARLHPPQPHDASAGLVANGAPPGGAGSAGWGYMSAVVPGLEASPAPAPGRRTRGWRTRRQEEPHEMELPSYGRSQWEKSRLPQYPAEPQSPAHFAGESTTDLLPRHPGAQPHGASPYGVFDRSASPPPLDGAADAASSALPRDRTGSTDVHRRSRSGAYAGDLGSPSYRLDGGAERGPWPPQPAPWDEWSASQPPSGARRADVSRPF